MQGQPCSRNSWKFSGSARTLNTSLSLGKKASGLSGGEDIRALTASLQPTVRTHSQASTPGGVVRNRETVRLFARQGSPEIPTPKTESAEWTAERYAKFLQSRMTDPPTPQSVSAPASRHREASKRCKKWDIQDLLALEPVFPPSEESTCVPSPTSTTCPSTCSADVPPEPSSETAMLQAVQGQLREALLVLQDERRERQAMAVKVHSMGQRLDDGLTSVQAVERSAREEGRSAADEALGSLQSYLDQIAGQCAWSAAQKEHMRQLFAKQKQQGEEMQALLTAMREQQAREASSSSAVQLLRVEVQAVANAVNVLSERVNAMENQTDNSIHTELGAVANVVTTLSERVCRLEPR
uniref:Uncharacterized protein n=1 Tax=Noctiluca scintillans TaxID=2966 RepID=A0A7S1FG13_NOCSC